MLSPISDYSKNTCRELIEMCKDKKIKGYSGKTKDKLIKLLENIDVSTPIEKQPISSAVSSVLVSSAVSSVLVSRLHSSIDSYTEELLKDQYILHKDYVKGRINTTTKIGVKVRLPSMPEDISENIVKNIIRNKLDDNTSSWECGTGDLQSDKEGKQECKCFTSDGPASFTPSSDWDVIYFLDARKWLEDKFVLYRIPLKRTSPEWKNIKVSKTQTFEDQTKQGRRPRITWESLYPQIQLYCTKVYEGTFYDIFSKS